MKIIARESAQRATKKIITRVLAHPCKIFCEHSCFIIGSVANVGVSLKTIHRWCCVSESLNQRFWWEKKCQTVSYAAENSSVFRCVLKVVMLAELFVTEDREFQTAGVMMLIALDWKLILEFS